MNRSTIAAISTPPGSGGIGVIRISGDRAVRIAAALFRPSRAPVGHEAAAGRDAFNSHRFYHGHIHHPATGQRIDEVLLVVMKAPRSYTREDVVEIQSHGGHVVLGQIFQSVLAAGADIAEPGEFTKRAFLNGRIDLTQAEAVCDIIHAKTEASLRLASRQLNGRLKDRLQLVGNTLNEVRVELEAAIDFPEEAGEIVQDGRIVSRLKQEAIAPLDALRRCHEAGRFLREGVRMAVVGRPNVGKSSLLNCLLEKDRAIVAATPGTTRDVIEESINVNGLPLVIMDTAGFQDATEEVELLGIAKTLESMAQADLLLFVIDASRPLCDEDRRIYQKIEGKSHILVLNKIDLLPAEGKDVLPESWKRRPVVRISAKKRLHIDLLKHAIEAIVLGDRGLVDEIGVVPNARHLAELGRSLSALERAVAALENGFAPELAAMDIREAVTAVETLVGERVSEDLLDRIFSRFCVGK